LVPVLNLYIASLRKIKYCKCQPTALQRNELTVYHRVRVEAEWVSSFLLQTCYLQISFSSRLFVSNTGIDSIVSNTEIDFVTRNSIKLCEVRLFDLLFKKQILVDMKNSW